MGFPNHTKENLLKTDSTSIVEKRIKVNSEKFSLKEENP
jgi:hypothetical protein